MTATEPPSTVDGAEGEPAVTDAALVDCSITALAHTVASGLNPAPSDHAHIVAPGLNPAPSDHAHIVGPVTHWFAANARDLPWRRPGFTAWGTLVSEFMLQQTPVSRVIPRLTEWLERWPTPAALAEDSPGAAVRAWQSLGYPRRALWLHAAAVVIVERHDGIVPRDVSALLALPGVGDYTARAVAAFAYGDRHPVVDTNIRRVIARAIGGDAEPGPPNGPRDLAAMGALLPEARNDARAFNAGMMELGAIVCTARAPRCELCPLSDLCAWRAAGYPGFTGIRKPVQKRYEGSDRQVRGLILAELRANEPAAEPVALERLEALWPDRQQFARALSSLVADGLAVERVVLGDAVGYLLP